MRQAEPASSFELNKLNFTESQEGKDFSSKVENTIVEQEDNILMN
jgi:hypothetical protein